MSDNETSQRIRLTVEGGPTREFPGDRTFVIGRSQNADFSIPHPNLSREHVRVSLRDGEVWLEDLGSANGTFVQGQRVPAKSSVKIKPGYRILLGTGSNVIVLLEPVEGYEPLPAPEPKGDVDLPTARERTLAAITRNQQARDAEAADPRERTRNTVTHGNKPAKVELDFPQQHFPHEVKKEKMAELRILEAKKQRVIEDIQYKEREVDDLRGKIREMREESLKLKEQTEAFKREVQPLADRKVDLEKCVAELDVIYEEKIDALESGFRDLKATLEESHSVRMARSDKEHKEKIRKLDEEYARKLQQLENETESVREEGEKLRDTLVREKKTLEESLRKVRAEAQELEAERRLTQVRIDTEIAQLQGQKLKLENELVTLKRDREQVAQDAASVAKQGEQERARLEEARRSVQEAKAEQERVRQAIEAVKQSEAKNLARIEELQRQIGELERRAEGIQESLRKAEADGAEIRDLAKREADEYRERMRLEADAYRKSAHEQAEAERHAIQRNTETQVASQLQAAEKQATAQLQSAHAEASTRVNTAEIQAATIVANAETEAATQIQKAQAEARVFLDRAQHEGNQYFEAKKVAADELFADAQARAAQVESGSKGGAERAMAEAHSQIDAKRRQFEGELSDMKKRNEQEIRQVRANALADIEAARERESREFSAKLRARSKEIGDQIDRIVGSKLSAQFGVTMDPVSLKAFSDEIHQIVETVVGAGKNGTKSAALHKTATGIETTLNNVLPVDLQARDRVARYWKRIGIAAGVCFALILGRILAPGVYDDVGRSVGRALEVKDNTDAVVKRMLRERQLAMTFVTEQDQQFRDSYTDNILYTEGFIEMKEDVETQKVWTLGLNKFFQGELGLTEKAIVQFGSAEGRVIRELVEQRKNIIPATSAVGVQKMREIEAPVLKEMKFIVRTEANWQRFLEFHRNFYGKYTETFINRAPASAE